MKKFVFTVIIIIALAAAGFFFGWAQFSVPPGSYGVIHSKTHGVDPKIVRSGEFRWVWYKLIPTNVKIAVFKLEPVKFDIRFNSSLPSGSVYANFAGISSDFSWDVKGVMTFKINPDMLVYISELNNLTDQEALDAYIKVAGQNIETFILRTLSATETDNERLENILSGARDIELERNIAALHPEIQDFSFTIQSARFPDFALYHEVRSLYEEFLAKQREIVAQGFGARADSHIAAQLHFDELDRYGQLLTKYPVLLDYMALEKDKE
jgi:hypothetical protein